MADLTQEEWVEQLGSNSDAVILDVRTADEFDEGYIPNAINIDIRQGQGFLDELEKLDKNKSYYVYCRSGARSAQACSVMEQLGFEEPHNLLGGILEWEGEIVEA
ncbi:rhodanese-like domain-containing protein [Sinomicrobium sp.]